MRSQQGSENASRSTFGKYQLIAALGSGGMADVYLAVSKGMARFNKLVVLKCLRKRWLEEELGEEGAKEDQNEFVEMFLEEARLAARLNHPNIVQTNEVGEESGDYFIAMEYLEGQSLNRITNRAWRKGEGIPLPIAVPILCEALNGLHHAHQLRDFDGKALEIVHRDASPHNVFVTYEGQTKVVDFGIAKASTRSFETRTGVLKGKIQYMAPEQARCGELDRRADVFSLGVVLWEVVARKRMWSGAADIEVLQRLVSEPVPRLVEFAPDVNPGLDSIVTRATAFDPADRFGTADEMRAALDAWGRANLQLASSQEIGQYVGQLFADKRALVATIIENQFAQIRRGDEISLQVMDPPTTLSRPNADLSTEGDGSNSSRRRAEGPPTLATIATSGSILPRAHPTRRGVWIALGAATVAGVAIAVATVGSTGPGAAASSAAAASAVASTALPAPQASADGGPLANSATADPDVTVVTLTVSAKPPSARIFIDDVLVTGNPYEGPFPRDRANHRVRVEADGFATEKRLVVFDADRRIELELLKAAPGPRVRPPPASLNTAAADRPFGGTSLPPPPPPADPAKGPGKPPKRELDKTDPWKKTP